MVRRIIDYLLIFAILCYFCVYSAEYEVNKQIENQNPYYLSFASIGAISLESRLDCWAKIKEILTIDEQKEQLIKVLQALEIPYEPSQIEKSKENPSCIMYQYVQDTNIYHIGFQINEKQNETYTMVTIKLANTDNPLLDYKKRLESVSKDWKCYYLFSGTIEGSVKETDKIFLVISNNLKIKRLETYEDQGASSMTGFSEKLNSIIEPVKIAGKDCNIQIAIRPNVKQNKTSVIIGSPLIMGNY